MEFTPRISQILKILLANGGPIGKQEIAEELGVSKRTVQREFEYLELCIRKYNLKLANYKGKGVVLEGNVEDLVKLEENLREEQYPDAADREGRRRRLLFELLRDRTPRKLFYYSQMLGVSEATAGSDMDSLCDWLEESHLGIVRRPGYGVILEGDERDYRSPERSSRRRSLTPRTAGSIPCSGVIRCAEWTRSFASSTSPRSCSSPTAPTRDWSSIYPLSSRDCSRAQP